MRLNNLKAKNSVVVLYSIFAVLFVFASVLFNPIKSLIKGGDYKYVFLFGILFLVFFFIHKMAKYFEYDSDGNVLVILNKGMLLSGFLKYKENRAEFPKKKLLHYKINNYRIYKTVDLYIRSQENRKKRLKFNVTLVSNKKLKYLRQSLDKVVKQNKAKV